MNELLGGVRRRLRLAWGVATAELVAPVVAAVALLLVVVGRLRPWTWPEPAALGVTAAGVLALALAVAALRVPITVAARAADRGLATGDAFFTALELDTRGAGDGPFPERVRARAGRIAAGHRAADAVPVRVHGRRLAVVGVLALAAGGLAFTANSQDDVRRRQAAEREVLAEEAAKLRDAAAELRQPNPPPGQEAVALRLEELARELAQAPDLAAGREALDAAARDLSSRVSSDLLSEKAAVRGLDRSLASNPLPGAGTGDAASQLRAEAAALAGLTPQARAALADRLATLAATQTAGNSEASSSLATAATALRAGDNSGAASALTAAANAQEGAAADVADQEAAMAGLGSIAAAQSNLATAGQGQQGQGQGQGQGQQGQHGQQGQGQGQGRQGQGQGQGGQQGQGSGGASGQVGGTNASQGSGQGGAGTPNGTGNNASVGLETATVFDPQSGGTDGAQLNTTGQQGEGPTQQAGKADAPSQRGSTQVPLADVLPRYGAEATRALGQLNIPPSQRALVQSYFASLGEGR